MNDRFFVAECRKQHSNRFRVGASSLKSGRCSWIAMGIAIAGSIMVGSSPAADKSLKVRDIDVKNAADLETMTADTIRSIVITKGPSEMSEKNVAVATAVYSARLGTDVTFDRSKKAFVLAHEFHSRDTVAEAVFHIAEPNAPSFAGVLAK